MSPYEPEIADDQQPEPPRGPGLGDAVLHAIARFPMTIVTVTVLGTVAALVVGLSQANQYTSAGKLLVRLGAREQRTPEAAVTGEDQVRGSVAAGDQLLMFQDPSLQRRVVEEVGVNRILRRYDPSQADTESTSAVTRLIHRFQGWLMSRGVPRDEVPDQPVTKGAIAAAVARVAAGVAINTQRQTNTIVVLFTAHDPELARLVVDAYLKVFQQRHREIYETTSELSFINEQLRAADEAADLAYRALQEQHERDDIHDLGETLNSAAAEIGVLAAQNVQDEIQREALLRQLQVVDEQLSGQLPAGADDIELVDLPATSAVQTFRYNLLVTQLGQANTELVELMSTYAADSEYMTQQRDRLERHIESLQTELAEIEAQQGMPQALLEQQPNLVLAQLVAQRLAILQQEQSLEAGIVARERQLEIMGKRFDELLLLEPVYNELQQAVAETAARADQMARSHSQAQILELIQADERMNNLIVTQEAALPSKKDGPDRMKILAIGFFGSLFFGMALATGRQLLDTRLRYPKGVEVALGLRVLGVVPEERRWRRSGRRLERAMKKRT